MKKKSVVIAIMMAAAVSAAACGKKQSTQDASASSSVSASDASASAQESGSAGEGSSTEAGASDVAAEETDADGNPVEEQYYDGVVQSMTATKLTVLSDEGETAVFDISKAQRDSENELLPTAYVEVTYTGQASSTTPVPASEVAVMMTNEEQADQMGVDPVLYGTIQFIDQNDLIVNDINGVEHSFDNTISRTVTFSQAQAGSEVCVTYIGTLDKEAQKNNAEGSGAGVPLALKIVTSDAYNSENAKENYITGVVNEVKDGVLTLDTSAETFEFTGDSSLFDGIQSDDKVNVYYNGAIGNRSVAATKVEKAG